MCEHCGGETRRATDVVRVARFLDALGLRAETSPKKLDPRTKAWLLAREEALITELEPVVGTVGKLYFNEVKASLQVMLDQAGDLTAAQATGLADALESTLKRAAKEFAKKAAPVVGEHAAAGYADARAVLTPGWTLESMVDKAAVAWMKKDPVLWVQKHFADDLTDRVRNVSARAIEQGLGRKELGARLEALLGDQVEGYRYWDVVAASNLTRSRTWAQNEAYDDQGVESYVWRTAADERVCPACDAMDGTVFSVKKAVEKQRAIVEAEPTPDEYKRMAPWVSITKDGMTIPGDDDDDEDVSGLFGSLTAGSADDGSALQDLGIDSPPIHGRCFLPGTVVQGVIVAGSKARYTGQAVKLRTAVERGLSVTPNHPVLTDKGLVPAGAICKGDKLVCYLGETWIGLLRPGYKGDENHAPASVEEVFGALLEMGSSVHVAASADDFHGDAACFDDEVHIVGANGVLLERSDAANVEQPHQGVFEVPTAGHAFVPSAGGLDHFVDGFLPAHGGGPRSRALPFNGATVCLQRGPLQPLRFGLPADWDVPPLEASREGGSVDAEFVRQLLERYPGQVALDEVIDVEVFAFTGHVYDLQSVGGWIVANNTVTSNCRCGTDPVD